MSNEIEFDRNSSFLSVCSVEHLLWTNGTDLLLNTNLQQRLESLDEFAGSHLNDDGLISGAAPSRLQGCSLPGEGIFFRFCKATYDQFM